ncbi:MAG: MFS transporter [Actinomycetota bacterium]
MTYGEHLPADAFRPLREWATTGFTWLLRMHAAGMAGDALVTVSLANSLFFSVPIGQARSKVALYLLTTMAPFALLAPFIGPLLDRTRSGRRLALAATMLGRAALVWFMASHTHSLELFPAALGVLMLSKGYAVARAAVAPRVLPRGATLVGVNARTTLTGAVAGAVAVPVGAALAHFTHDSTWTLRLATLVFLAATVFAFRLPKIVNSGPHIPSDATDAVGAPTPRVASVVRAAAALRALAGFLTFFLAFRVKLDGRCCDLEVFGHFTTDEATFRLGMLGVAAIGASIAGTAVGALARQHAPERLLQLSLFGAGVVLLMGAVHYDFRAAIFGVVASGLFGSLGKLGLDTILQRDVEEHVRAQAFARSETALQLAWVIGGALGLIPMPGTVGFAAAAILVGVATFTTVRALRARAGSLAISTPSHGSST